MHDSLEQFEERICPAVFVAALLLAIAACPFWAARHGEVGFQDLIMVFLVVLLATMVLLPLPLVLLVLTWEIVREIVLAIGSATANARSDRELRHGHQSRSATA